MAEKHDFLATCNELGVPSQDFEAQFCSRCLQRECHRSQHGKSHFEDRVLSWQERLFKDVPRMGGSDPRLPVIQAKRFIDIDTGPIPEIGRGAPKPWIDPRDLDVAVESSQATPDPVVLAPNPEPVSPLIEAATPTASTTTPQIMNTPVQQGRMIGGRNPEPPRDPWEVTPKETQGIRVVQPGARIKLGGSGV